MTLNRHIEVLGLYEAGVDAEKRFVAAYTADPNRKGMRPGDFRYMSQSHSLETRIAGEQFSAAMDAWREAFRASNGVSAVSNA